ncbi:leucine-rich repeat domain-containing protein [Metabacillus halosaccharovorans]|uniref:leucine-rich repeat domain-containing protein n=1 Tax=Metabacillus halosaccharovorans TaxID=930124 RepID=UPI001C1FAF01|nr:leucine-rich repeat domain-containing protein [Metabacillus halosaccharovorans]MBU7594532.1 LPXTG cell wall anchor domain-containing protein [Metabacillus halosaccharovorans]
MKKRFVTLSLVFTLLFSIFVPFVQKVDAEESSSITFLPAVNTEEGIQLLWKTVSTSSDEEVFSVEKNNEELSAELIKELNTVVNENEIERTYQLLDTDVVAGGEYTYTVKKTGEASIQTNPLSVTYKQEVQELTLKITNITENSITISWSDIQQADAYQLIINGKTIEQSEDVSTYELKGLTSGTSYSVNVRAIQNEKVITEASQTVKTEEAEVKEEPKSTTTETETPVSEPSTIKEIKKASTETVTIPDSALKRAITQQLGIQTDHITITDIESLTELDASYQNIENLSGLEKAVNVTKLNLSGNEFEDVDLLKNLTKLETLDISLTNVTDLSPLAALTSLRDIDISYLELETILPLKDLSLTSITMFGDRYFLLKEEVAVLEKANVEIVHDDYFNVYFSSIKANENRAIINWEYEGEEDVDQYQLKVDGNEVSTISADDETSYTLTSLAANTEYSLEIFAYNNKGELIGQAKEKFQTLSDPTGGKEVTFKDLQLEKAIQKQFDLDRKIVESDMKHLKELSLERKRITDLTGLETATNLEYLYLSTNKVSNISQLALLKNLKYVYLDGNPISDFTPLSELTNLISLGLGNTGVKNLSFLANLQALEDLSLDNNELESLSTLPKLNQLAYLSVYDNKVTSLKGLEKLENLTSLSADENPITSLEDLDVSSKLRDLNLSYTLLENIDRLLDLKELEYVSLYGVDLSGNNKAMDVIKTLEEKNVYVEYESTEEEEWFEVYVGTVTENSMQLMIDYYGEKEVSTYDVLLNGKVIETLPADETYYELKGLTHNTEYEIEVRAYGDKENLLFTSNITETTWDKPAGEVIPFKDQNLKELIKAELGLERDPVESDMEHLNYLYLIEEEIKDLSGLEFAINLFDFNVLGNTEELDLAPLAQLAQLNYISIDDTPIKNYSVLKNMKNLQSLSIVNNQLNDLSFLQGLKNLTDITLQNNGIKDITAFSSLKKLNFISLANNQITDITPLLASKNNLYSLDLSGNPIEDLSVLAQFEELSDLNLDETNVTDLSPIEDLYSLQYVSLYGVPLDNDALKVVEKLRANDVQVNLDVDNTPELYIDEVTDTSISVSWDPMIPMDLAEEYGVYTVNLYENYEEVPVQQTKLSGAETSYQFTELKPNTSYTVEIMIEESEEYYGYLSTEVTTLPTEGSVKDVSLYVYDTEDNPAFDVMFDLYGIDPETEEQYFYGWSDEDGRLWDHTGEEAVDILSLPVGEYEILFTTEAEEEITFQFEIEKDKDYLNNPIYFLLNENPDEQTPPAVEPDDEDQQTGSQPVKVSKPSQPDKVKTEKAKKNKETNKNQKLPNTATMTHNLLLLGIIVLLVGSGILFIQKRKKA